MPPCRSRRKGKRQRFYARNAVNTTLPWFRGPFDAVAFRPRFRPIHAIPAQIRPALTSFADEVCATVARLFAYVGALALFGHPRRRVPGTSCQAELTAEPASEAAWSVADRSPPAFALSRLDSSDKSKNQRLTMSFGIPRAAARTSCAGAATGGKPVAELEIYRPGGEYRPGRLARRRHWPRGWPGRRARTGGRRRDRQQVRRRHPVSPGRRQRRPRGACLGFFKRIDDPPFSSPAGPAGATACRPAAPRSAAC